MNEPRRILQVNTQDIGGGAARIAWVLHHEYRRRGIDATLAVGKKKSDEPSVIELSNDSSRSAPARVALRIAGKLERDDRRGAWRLGRAMSWAAQPRREWNRSRGMEDFDFPGTGRLVEMAGDDEQIQQIPGPSRTQVRLGSHGVVHLHNLHGGYFDLRALPALSRQATVAVTLHDAWMLSGHCAHSLSCERWATGCGSCPSLDLYPAVKRDATAFNWRRKAGIYARSRLHVATPCRWLMEKVERSMLAAGAVSMRVIPNGVDLSVFKPAKPQAGVREKLGLPVDARVMLFAAGGIRKAGWKDFATLREVVGKVAARLGSMKVVFVALGEDGPAEKIGAAEVRFVPFSSDAAVVASYYQAADVYVHAAKADTFPNTVLEALACGTPVVATAVGGIPEQIEEGVTGFLTPAGDAEAMAWPIVTLLTDDRFRGRLSRNAAETARERFSLERQVNAYLAWYGQMAESAKPQAA